MKRSTSAELTSTKDVGSHDPDGETADRRKSTGGPSHVPGSRSWMRLSNLGIGRRLGGTFGILVALTLALGAIAITSLRSVDSTYSELIAKNAANRAEALGLQTDIAREAAAFRGFLLTGNDGFLDEFTKAQSAFAEGMTAIRNRDREVAARLDEIAAKHEAYLATVAEARNAAKQGDKEGAAAIVKAKVGPANQAAQGALDPFVEAQSAALASGKQEAKASASSARWLAIGGLALAVILAITLAFLITRSITNPLRRLREASKNAAEGDLTIQVGNDSRDEVGQVSQAFDDMLRSFRDIVAHVTEAARTQTQAAREVADASHQSGQAVAQIAATVEDMARGASEQAEGTQRATSTVDEMARGVAQVAEGGQAASAAAQEADQAAESGTQVVEEATQAIGRISERVEDAASVVTGLGEKGQAIGEIVGAIDQIASQTNLLALNAAIEAARAGEQGRGFAVVAEEVRQLAEESQKAAASIAEIIHDIQQETSRAVEAMAAGREEVRTGVESVGKAGAAFGMIREQVERVSAEVTQVAAASQELEAGAQQVQEQIAGVAAVSQENAAAAEEVSASTEETSASSEQVSASAAKLASDAEELAGLVARFTV
jgi:methyl-accepting chemotaxis protein